MRQRPISTGQLTANRDVEMNASNVHTMTRKAAVSRWEMRLCQHGFRKLLTGITLGLFVASAPAQSASVAEY